MEIGGTTTAPVALGCLLLLLVVGNVIAECKLGVRICLLQ